ncbi:MAG: PorP/SprF family type IX secretion system membrane protein [Lewinella sp.]|uniref:PorP/SprF family type IX secretion system membrane protein n=1 Tax=Lewinella sp. TaxID=2004506 RepID=UPI003D6AC45A
MVPFFHVLLRAATVATCWLLFQSPSLRAQDFIFSQFFNTPLHLNPAYVGINGGLTGTATYRRQWNQIPNGFNSFYASVESFEPCLPGAIGLSFARDIEGEGLLTTTAAKLQLGFVARIEGRRSVHNFRLGISPYWMEKRIDWDRLVFSDQLDPRFGNVNATAFDPGSRVPVQFAGVDFGFIHRVDIRKRGKEDLQFDYGIALNNLLNVSFNTGPIESLQGLDTPLPLRWTAHGSLYLPFLSVGNGQINRFRLVPQFRLEGQGGINATTLGLTGLYQGGSLGLFYHNSHPFAGFQNTDALIAYLGLAFDLDKRQALEIGLSYDINIGGLRSASGGVVEVNIRYYLQSGGLFCSVLSPGGAGKGRPGGRSRKGSVQCPPVGRSHHRRWNNSWYR